MTRSTRLLLALASLAATVPTAGCPDKILPTVTAPPPVASLEVVPHTVDVPATGATEFRLSARLKDAYGGTIPDAYHVPRWLLGGNTSRVALFDTIRHTVMVKVTPGASTAEAVASASVEAVSSAPAATIKINPGAGGPDRVHALHATGAPPAIALLDSGPPGCGDTVVAFVLIGGVGDRPGRCAPGRVSVFSRDWAMVLQSVAWTDGANDVRIDQNQVSVLSIPVAIWVAVADEPEDALSLQELRTQFTGYVSTDVQTVNALLRANRAGLTIDVIGGFPKTLTTQREDHHCGEVLQREAGVLNVYYVNQIRGGGGGVYCRRPSHLDEDVIYLSLGYNKATLAHELGHALGLTFPQDGHTIGIGFIKGFDLSNVMADGTYPDRSRYSLGQAFRMSAETASWVNQHVGGNAAIRQGQPTVECQCDPYVGKPCPRLAEDVTPVDDGGQPIEDWKCGDQVWLMGTGKSDSGAALLSGRSLRPDVCAPDLPGRPYWDADSTYLRLYFSNVTGPGACASHLSLFFDDGAVTFVDIPPAGPWTYELNHLTLWQAPVTPLDVLVNIWYRPAHASLAAADRELATTIYAGRPGGRSNRTGIILQMLMKGLGVGWDDAALLATLKANCSVPAASTQPISHTINVYYLSEALDLVADGGYSCRSPISAGTFMIALPVGVSHSSTALAHHLGHMLALADVTNTAYGAGNVMWHDKLGGRTAFKLGQVFRMTFDSTSWLNISPSSMRWGATPQYLCTPANAGQCPALIADVR